MSITLRFSIKNQYKESFTGIWKLNLILFNVDSFTDSKEITCLVLNLRSNHTESENCDVHFLINPLLSNKDTYLHCKVRSNSKEVSFATTFTSLIFKLNFKSIWKLIWFICLFYCNYSHEFQVRRFDRSELYHKED
jgi:hypothetical protein